jgi:hypothetical protein
MSIHLNREPLFSKTASNVLRNLSQPKIHVQMLGALFQPLFRLLLVALGVLAVRQLALIWPPLQFNLKFFQLFLGTLRPHRPDRPISWCSALSFRSDLHT